ncbi:MAG TPA: hypothetical protein VE715_08285 [Blastocatellia bacterium]|nr:hypothetical protein [Blastocatellia bacterium]
MVITPAITKSIAINFTDLTVINLPSFRLNEVALNLDGCEGCFKRLQGERGPSSRALELIRLRSAGAGRAAPKAAIKYSEIDRVGHRLVTGVIGMEMVALLRLNELASKVRGRRLALEAARVESPGEVETHARPTAAGWPQSFHKRHFFHPCLIVNSEIAGMILAFGERYMLHDEAKML